MTIKELRELLTKYPDETQVVVIHGRTLKEIEVGMVYDQDSNEGSVCLSPKLELQGNFC